MFDEQIHQLPTIQRNTKRKLCHIAKCLSYWGSTLVYAHQRPSQCTMLVRCWIFLVHLDLALTIMVHSVALGKLLSSNFQFF